MLLACLLTAFAATVQGTIGFGFAILSVPVLSLLDPALAPVPQLLIMWVMTFGMFWRERRDVDLRGVGILLFGDLAVEERVELGHLLGRYHVVNDQVSLEVEGVAFVFVHG